MHWSASPSPLQSARQPLLTGLRHILCVTDIHAPLDAALQRASALGKQFQAHVHVVYADSQRKAGPLLHLRHHDALPSAPGMDMFMERPQSGSVHVRSIRGRPDRVVAEISGHFDLIVVSGARTEQDDQQWPEAEQIVRASKAPVLVVRAEATRAYGDITIVTDLSASSLRLFRAMADYRCLDASNISVVHAFGLPYRGLRTIPRIIPDHLQLYRMRWQRLVLQQLRADLVLTGLEHPRMQLHADLATPMDLIERHIEQTGSDLVVAGRTQLMPIKGMFGKSTTRRILNSLDCDVLVVP
jgi:nucleotide-binding universal stress UspA family protein